MRTDKLTAAIAEARRFLDRACELDLKGEIHGMDSKEFRHGQPLVSAARRASLDLTRALAALRSSK